ncbi:MAG: nucleotidyltransferase family protein [Bryobacteraceae bacterium]|nr:nucleotidyltransferase family protein [Bryobacteraceae bacterium]
MPTLEALRLEKRDQIIEIAARHGDRNLRVFGSVARGESHEGSDLDLPIEWEPGRSLFDQVHLVEDLQALLGVRVDVATERSLHRLLKNRILREAVPL